MTLPSLKGTLALPRLVERAAEPVLILRADMPLMEIDSRGPGLLAQVLDHLAGRGIAPVGPGFFRYDVIDMPGTMSMSFGVPVPPGTAGDAAFESDTIPAGRYISVRHHGHPDELYDATIMLIAWAEVRGVAWDVATTLEGDRFAARMEVFHSGPETPMGDWTTEILIRLAD